MSSVERLDMQRVEEFIAQNECCATTTTTTRWSENPDYCCGDTTTTTSTSTTSTTTTTTIVAPGCVLEGYARSTAGCLEGIVIETIYLYNFAESGLLPPNYVHPCPSEIGTHICNRACFEVTGNGVYIGDSLMNNAGGPTGGLQTAGGHYICEDYGNTPAPLTGGVWTGSAQARYSKMIIDAPTAAAVAAAGGGGTTITFALVAAMTTYGQICDTLDFPHTNITWTRISTPSGVVLYNGCPVGNFLTIDICATPS